MDRDFDFVRGVRREVGSAAAMDHPAAVHEHGKANKSRDCGFHCPMLLRRAVGRTIGPTGVEDGAELEVGGCRRFVDGNRAKAKRQFSETTFRPCEPINGRKGI